MSKIYLQLLQKTCWINWKSRRWYQKWYDLKDYLYQNKRDHKLRFSPRKSTMQDWWNFIVVRLYRDFLGTLTKVHLTLHVIAKLNARNLMTLWREHSWVIGVLFGDFLWCEANRWFVQTNSTLCITRINTLRPRQNGHNFQDDIFKCIFWNENK